MPAALVVQDIALIVDATSEATEWHGSILIQRCRRMLRMDLCWDKQLTYLFLYEAMGMVDEI